MTTKEIKRNMGFRNGKGNFVKIPEDIQKHIEAREEFWVNKIKTIDIKCGIVLERLALTEKALELACEEITGSCEYCSYKTMIECPVEADCLDEKINYFKTKAKEIMKSE